MSAPKAYLEDEYDDDDATPDSITSLREEILAVVNNHTQSISRIEDDLSTVTKMLASIVPNSDQFIVRGINML